MDINPQQARIFRPGYLTAFIVLLVLSLAVFAYFEIETSQEILLESMHRGSVSLVEAIARGGENALRSDAEIEALAAHRLLSAARLIRDVELGIMLSDTMLVRIAKENALFRTNVFDQEGQRIASNAPGAYGGHGARGPRALESEIGSILSGDLDEKVIGFKEARFESGNRFAAVVGRRAGGAVVVNIDAAQMLAFRQAAGVGRLIQEVGENPGVIYVVLQDREGILLASRGITSIPRIDGDPFLEGVLAGGDVQSRETLFEGSNVYETAMTFAVDEKTDGLLRVGLSADVLQAQDKRLSWRLGVLAGLVVLLCATGIGLRGVLKERVLLEATLKRQDRLAAMGELASGVAHEVRNPLNAIGMIVQRLEREFEPVSDSEGYTKLTQTVRDEVRRVNGIVQQFLAFARPPKLSRKAVDLMVLLEKTVRVAAPQAEAKGLRLVTSLDTVGTLQIDPEQFQQAMQNVLQNAMDATEAGEVRLVCRIADAKWVEVTVQDTGAGIAPADQERIFDLYFTTKPEGTGLGLSLVHRIVAEHGGHIEVESQEGAGMLFRMMLLRVLQERTIERVGGNTSIPVDVRLISATNRDLSAMVEDGTFREDLFYRLNVVTIQLPPLKDRRQDIPVLLDAFLKHYSEENGKEMQGVSREARDVLMRYPYPGNVRELQNTVERAVVLARGNLITLEDLSEEMLGNTGPEKEPQGSLPMQVEALERQSIARALEEANGVQSRAAELLGITERNLRYKLKKYGFK